MKNLLRLTAAALLLCAAGTFVSCANDDDDDDESSPASLASETSPLSGILNVRYGTGVSGKAIFKYYTVLEGNKIRYEQTKFGNYTSDVTWDYVETENEDGSVTLAVSNGVQAVEGAAYGDESITYLFNDDGSVTITSTYYEMGAPVESTSTCVRVYSGIENIIGNTYAYTVSGKSISLSYAFGKDGVTAYKMVKYGNSYADEKYACQITAWNVLYADAVLADDGATELLAFSKTSYATALNTYAVHFTQAETGSHTVVAVDYTNGYATTEQTVETTAGDEAGYILITLTGDIASDGSGTFTVTTCEETTAEDGTTSLTEVVNSSSGTSSSEFTLYTE